jgi:hypothetical protein
VGKWLRKLDGTGRADLYQKRISNSDGGHVDCGPTEYGSDANANANADSNRHADCDPDADLSDR